MITLPNPNPIPNSAQIFYDYLVSETNIVSENVITNTVITQVNATEITQVKYTSLNFAKINNIIDYTVVLNSSGNTTANNVIFTDTIPTGTSFVTNSTFINTVNIIGANPSPPTGINMGSIGSNTINTISFKVRVVSIPSPNPILNSATTRYEYTVTPTIPNERVGSTNSNIVATFVNQAIIDNNSGGLIKYVNLTAAKVNDVLIYTIVLKNTGNTAANNLVLTDTIPASTNFTPNSVKINSNTQLGANPNPPTGVSIGTILPGATTTVTFEVTVVTIPTINPIPNNSTVRFNYTAVQTLPNGEASSGNSNTVNTFVDQAIIDTSSGGLVKYVDKTSASIGDTLLYTIVLKNTGNVTANNVILTDTIPSNTTFVTNSVQLNGITQPGQNPSPPTGLTVGQLVQGQSATVTFNVRIVTTPTSQTIPNSSSASFQFVNNPQNPVLVTGFGNSNSVLTTLSYASISTIDGSLTKYTNKQIVIVGETITYSIVIRNTGSTAASNVVFYDTIPTATSFVPNSFTFNSSIIPGNPQTGVALGTLNPNDTGTITFDVIVTTIPASFNIVNNGDIAYDYVIDTVSGATTSARNTTNSVNNPIANMNFSQNKYCDKSFVDIGDTVNYTLVLRNNGNVTSSPTIIQDTIPSGTGFILDSLRLNGTQVPGINPETSYNIGALGPSTTQTVTFQVIVVSLPVPNPITNTFNTRYIYTLNQTGPSQTTLLSSDSDFALFVNNGGVDITKSQDKDIVTVPDTLNYTIVLRNRGNVAAENIVFYDTIPVSTSFVYGSLLVDNVATSGNPSTGISISNLASGEARTINFQVSVVSIPRNFIIANSGRLNYGYIVNPNEPIKNSISLSNEVVAQLNVANLYIEKSSSSNIVCQNSDITFTLNIFNNGNVAANNVVVLDTLPAELAFVIDSVYVNDINIPGANISNTGVSIASIGPSSSTNLRFSATLVSIPSALSLTNAGWASYNYNVTTTIPVFTSTISNTVRVITSYCLDTVKTINPCIICNTHTIPQSKCGTCNNNTVLDEYTVLGICSPTDYACISETIAINRMWSQNVVLGKILLDTENLSEIDSVEGCLKIFRNDTIETPNSCNSCNIEGKFLTGYKQVIEGIVTYIVSYVDNDGNFINSTNCEYFSSFIVIPEANSSRTLYARGCIEDIQITGICKGEVSLSSLVLIYLTTSSDDCNSTVSCLSTCENNNSVSNSNIDNNISKFLSQCENYWSEFNAYNTMILPLNMGINNLLGVYATGQVINYKVVTTPEAYSYSEEGLFLTGKKLFVNIMLKVRIDYSKSGGSNNLMRKMFVVPCSTYIVINDTETCKNKFSFAVAIEDVYACLIDANKLFTNTTLIVKATPCN